MAGRFPRSFTQGERILDAALGADHCIRQATIAVTEPTARLGDFGQPADNRRDLLYTGVWVMRRDHHPIWVERALDRLTQAWAARFLLPQFDRVGAEPRFQGQKWIHVQGPNVRAGDNLHVFATAHLPVSMCVNPYDGGMGFIDIGNWCVISSGVRIRSAVGVTIGDSCMLAESVFITDADWHDIYHRILPGKREPVRIGNNVWIGDRATVCKGVTIGENSVIGAASVVTKDIPPNTIAAGNPARAVGEIDPSLPSSRREELFVAGSPYDEFKDAYDRQRLRGNTLHGWLRAMIWPTRES